MERTELVKYTRSEIDRLKELGITKLRRERNLAKLEEIAKTIDYSPFKDNPKPKFSISELQLEGEDDAVAVSFFRHKNPYVGPGDFYKKWTDTVYFLANEAGRSGREIGEVENAKSLSILSGATLEEFCGMVPILTE